MQVVRDFILKDMHARWDPTDILLGMGAITRSGHKSLSWLNAEKKQAIIDQLQSEMFAISHLDDAGTAGASDTITAEPEATEPAAKCIVQADENFNVLFGWSDNTEIPVHEPLCALGDRIEDELQRYLKEVEINFHKYDPLMRWKCRGKSFPIISRLARKYLAIPASTAPSEFFSTAKTILQKKRWRLIPNRLSRCIFLKKTLNYCSIRLKLTKYTCDLYY